MLCWSNVCHAPTQRSLKALQLVCHLLVRFLSSPSAFFCNVALCFCFVVCSRLGYRPLEFDLLTGWLRNRSEEHTSELQSLMRISYAVFCLKKKNDTHMHSTLRQIHTYNMIYTIIANHHHKKEQ